MNPAQSRRSFLAGLSSTGAAGLLGVRPSTAQEDRLEATPARNARIAGTGTAAEYFRAELLRAEGFPDVRSVATQAGLPAALSLARGDVDFTANFAPALTLAIDAGEPITILGG